MRGSLASQRRIEFVSSKNQGAVQIQKGIKENAKASSVLGSIRGNMHLSSGMREVFNYNRCIKVTSINLRRGTK